MYANSEQTGLWHALHTRHQHEQYVTDILAEKGFEVFAQPARSSPLEDRGANVRSFRLFIFRRVVGSKIDLLSPQACAIASLTRLLFIEINAIRSCGKFSKSGAASVLNRSKGFWPNRPLASWGVTAKNERTASS
jgi:hypothetical protein